MRTTLKINSTFIDVVKDLKTQGVISEVVCAMCKQCLITTNHDVYVLNYVNDMNSSANVLKENVSNVANKKRQRPKVWKPKKVGPKERLTSPESSKPRTYLRWSPTRIHFDLKGKLMTSSKSECQSDCSEGDNALSGGVEMYLFLLMI
ncbi:hypothetical protein Tco_0280634 [Tanacetum coccineum]